MALPLLGFASAFLRNMKPRAAEHQPVRSLRDPPPAEIFLVPIGGRCRIGHVQMDVVVGKRLRRGGTGESPKGEA